MTVEVMRGSEQPKVRERKEKKRTRMDPGELPVVGGQENTVMEEDEWWAGTQG